MWIVPRASHAVDSTLEQLKTQGIDALGFALSTTTPTKYEDEEGLGVVTSFYTAQILQTKNPLLTFSYSAYKLLLARGLQVEYIEAKNAMDMAEKLNKKPQKLIHYTSNISENLWYEKIQKKGHEIIYKQVYKTQYADKLPKDVKEALSKPKRCAILIFSKASATEFLNLCEGIDLSNHRFICISQEVADCIKEQTYTAKDASLTGMIERAKNVI